MKSTDVISDMPDGSHLNKLAYLTTAAFLSFLPMSNPSPFEENTMTNHSSPSVSDAIPCQTVWSWPR